jgi:CxxC motif-containing protein (DUF1111 family)
MRRLPIPVFLALVGALVLGASRCAPPVRPGDPVTGLTAPQRVLFEKGRTVVEREFTPDTGLGPLFNAPSCAECHEDPATGGAGDEKEIHVALVRSDGSCDPLADRGGPVIQQQVTPALREALGITSEPVPPEASARATRSTPDIFGFGLLDAIPDAEILSHADPDDRDGDGISGRPNRFFDGRLGRFGRKALVPTLREFIEGAFVVEQGITVPAIPAEETVGGNPLPPGVDPTADPEIDQETVDAADAFVRFLAPPAPSTPGWAVRHGRAVFSRIGCAACHIPVLKTGENPVRALSHRPVPAYSDLLLHDMGPDLADICLGLATPSEFRTEPLMGAHLMKRFLHDGRAGTLEEAILLHAGEAGPSRDRFKALSDADRVALLKFLGSL